MKPVLIGMNNPVSSAPGHELFPYPPGCTGHRIMEMLKSRVPEITRRQYLDSFERRNLVVGFQYDKKLAAQSAARIYAELWGSGRTVVLFGRDVQIAFGIPPLLVHPQESGGTTWRQLPHPSGRNLWYNDQKNRDVAAVLLEELYNIYRKELTDACH